MKVYVEPHEIEQMEEQAACVRDKLLIRLLFHLGCRVSEALGLRVEDVDFERGSVTIEHLKAGIRLSCAQCGARLGRTHTFCPKCGAKIEKMVIQEQQHRRLRTLPLDGDTLEMLGDYIRHAGPVSQKDSMFIFGINRHRAWQVVRDCADKAGLGRMMNPETGKARGVSPHRLRDAFAVMAAKADDSGDGLRLLQEHLGHASFNTTAKYRKVAGEEHRRWYEKLWAK